MWYRVYTFYPNLGIQVRVTDFEYKDELNKYVLILRLCDTPYCIQGIQGDRVIGMIEIEYADITMDQMAGMIVTLLERMEENE